MCPATCVGPRVLETVERQMVVGYEMSAKNMRWTERCRLASVTGVYAHT